MTMTVSGRGRWIGDRQKRDPRVQRGKQKRREARQVNVLTLAVSPFRLSRGSRGCESTSKRMA